MTATTERSIRLNQSHRTDMANAVMDEWEKQNPPPAAPGHVALLEVIAPQLKKHAAYKRTQRMAAAMEGDDKNHVQREASINIAIMNKQGEQRNTMRVHYPLSIARRLGIAGIPDSHALCYSDSFAPADLEDSDLDVDHELNPKTLRTPQNLRIKCVQFIEARYPTVQIDDSAAPMVALREARKARHEWEQRRETLGRETRDLLENFNTTKQLREGWPEIVPYLPPHIADTRGVNLPVMATSRLSERLGIKGGHA